MPHNRSAAAAISGEFRHLELSYCEKRGSGAGQEDHKVTACLLVSAATLARAEKKWAGEIADADCLRDPACRASRHTVGSICDYLLEKGALRHRDAAAGPALRRVISYGLPHPLRESACISHYIAMGKPVTEPRPLSSLPGIAAAGRKGQMRRLRIDWQESAGPHPACRPADLVGVSAWLLSPASALRAAEAQWKADLSRAVERQTGFAESARRRAIHDFLRAKGALLHREPEQGPAYCVTNAWGARIRADYRLQGKETQRSTLACLPGIRDLGFGK